MLGAVDAESTLEKFSNARGTTSTNTQEEIKRRMRSVRGRPFMSSNWTTVGKSNCKSKIEHVMTPHVKETGKSKERNILVGVSCGRCSVCTFASKPMSRTH